MMGKRAAAAVVVLLAVLPASRAFPQQRPPAPSPRPGSWPSMAPPRPLDAHEVKFPSYQLRTLPNGMQVVVVLHHEQPAVSIRLIVRAGAAEDPRDRAGVAALVSSLLDQGTTTKSARQIAEAIDSVGGALSTGAGRDLTYAHVTVMKDSLDLGLRLLADIVRHPAFADAEIARQRAQLLSALRVSYADPEYIADAVFDRVVYGASPYGAPGNGTPETLPTITRADLRAFHERWFAPNNCLLAVVGDVTAEEAFAAVASALGDWPRRDLPAETRAEPPKPGERVIVVDKPDAVQTEVRVGHLGIPRKQRDFMALDQAVRILGGEGANRLHRILRVERGLTYGAAAEMETLKRAGEVVAVTNTRSDATADVVKLVVDEFARMRREHVDAQELASAQAYMIGNFPLRLETPDDIATQVLNVLFYDLPIDDLQTYPQRVNRVTVDDIARVSAVYLRPDKLCVVLVGNAQAFVSQLKAAGFDKYEIIPAGDIDFATADLRRRPAPTRDGSDEDTPSGPSAFGHGGPSFVDGGVAVMDDQERQDAGALLDRVVRTKGGVDRLRALRTIVMSGTSTVAGATPVVAHITNYIEYPDRFRQDARLPAGTVTQVWARGDTWMKDASGVHDVPNPSRENLAATVSRDIVLLLLGASDGRLAVTFGDAAPQPPQPTTAALDTLRFSGGAAGPVDLFVDRATGQIVGRRYIVQQPGAVGKVPTEEWYSDYRVVEGMQVAFTTVVRRGAATILEQRLAEFRTNVPIAGDLFTRPPQ